MAAAKHVKGTKLVIKVGDGETVEAFDTLCTISAERGITFTAGTNDSEEYDCADPDAVSWVLKEKTNLSAAITGSGSVHAPDVSDFYDWLVSPDSKNCKVIMDVPGADGGVVFTGKFHLTEFSVTGNKGEKVQASLSLASDGEVTKAVNA